jgi:transcriptional regulator with XRE-family HTH domain
MARPNKMHNWWLLLVEKKADGRVDELARLLGVSVRTLHRWYTGDIKVPDLEKRKRIQQVAGPELLKHPQCPKYLRFRVVTKGASKPVPTVESGSLAYLLSLQ